MAYSKNIESLITLLPTIGHTPLAIRSGLPLYAISYQLRSRSC
jgi:hypothetical protein